MCQRGEAELDDLPSALTNRSVDGRGQRGQVKGQDFLGAGGEQLLAVQAVVRCPFGSVRLHDALKVAAEGVFRSEARTGDQDGRFQGGVVVVKERFHRSGQKGRVEKHNNNTQQIKCNNAYFSMEQTDVRFVFISLSDPWS